MTHIDTDQLALIALAEIAPVPAHEVAHLNECAACAEELRELSSVIRIGRSAEGESLAAPPPEVWQRIRSELGTSAADEMSQTATSRGAAAPSSTSHVATRHPRRRWRTRVVVPVTVAALVVGLVSGAGLGIWWQSLRAADTGIAVAGAELDPFPEWADARGSAVVSVLGDGRRQVVVDIDTAGDPGPDDARLREVWLISADGTSLVSIGFLDGPEGRFDVPSGVDLSDYTLVDISAEPDDGDKTHSGNSIVRGELRSI